MAGQKRARAQGVKIGRPSKLNDAVITSVKLLRDGGMGIKEISKRLKIGVRSVYAALNAAPTLSWTTISPVPDDREFAMKVSTCISSAVVAGTLSLYTTAYAADNFPQMIQGYWSADQKICKALKRDGVGMMPSGTGWLKIAKTTIVGDSLEGKFRSDLVEVQSQPQMLDLSPAIFSAFITTTWVTNGDSRTELEHLALGTDDNLYETIQGARASTIYVRCR